MTQAPPTAPNPAETAKKVRTILWILIGVIVAAGGIWYAVFTAAKPAPTAVQPVADAELVREDSHRVTADSQAALFRTLAQELGLDMDKYDATVADEKTRDRIRKDVADGTALGVTGTPTFFLNGEKLTLNTEDEFRQKLANAAK